MSSQANLFGSSPSKKPAKADKAKALPKVQPSAKAPAKALTPAQKGEATKALNRLQSLRASLQIGDMRLSERECSECDGEQLEVLEARGKQGGLTWGVYCLNKQCERCPDHGLGETWNK